MVQFFFMSSVWSAYHLFCRKFSPTAPKMALMPADGFIIFIIRSFGADW
jgi:hypothetical protein